MILLFRAGGAPASIIFRGRRFEPWAHSAQCWCPALKEGFEMPCVSPASAVMGLVGVVVPLPELYSKEGLRVIAGVTYLGSNAKARREWGYDPRPLEVGLKETLDHELALLGDQQEQLDGLRKTQP